MKQRNWKDATVETIDGLRHVVSLGKGDQVPLTKISLYSQSRQIVESMGVTGARFWPVFINTVRILRAVDSKKRLSKSELFGEDESYEEAE